MDFHLDISLIAIEKHFLFDTNSARTSGSLL